MSGPTLTIDCDRTLRAVGASYFECTRVLESKAEAELFFLLTMVAIKIVMSIPGARFQLEPQHPMLQYRLDVLVTVLDRPIAFEADGLAYHSDQASFARDRQRDRAIAQAGVETYRFTANEIFHRSQEVGAELWRIFLAVLASAPR